MKQTLWTKDFSLITLGTIFSAIGGVGLSLALSVTVYNNTGSTLLAGLYSALTVLPSIFLPIFISPLIDQLSRKKIIVFLDYMMGILFLLFAFLTRGGFFNFYLYSTIGILINLNGIIYNLAYSSLFPSLIPKGMFQKGYAIGSLIYPLTNVFILPIATVVFDQYGVSIIFTLQGILLLLSATAELFITTDEREMRTQTFSFKKHLIHIQEGFLYLLKEKGILSVYLFFVVMMFADGINVLIYPFFEKSETLTLVNYSLLLSFQSAGYMLGGFLHYFIKIPTLWRYTIAVMVYALFGLLDAVFFFMPFIIMLLIKLVLGVAGSNSANIRVSSINHYIEDDRRGRLNAIYQTMINLAILLGRFVAGWLGEYFHYATIGIFYSILIFIGIWLFILQKKMHVKALYNQAV